MTNSHAMPDSAVMKLAEKLYADLSAGGVEVILDDRDERPGVKFKDADLFGIPVGGRAAFANFPKNHPLHLGSGVQTFLKDADLVLLAREELRHYEQVAKLIRSMKIVPQRLAPGRYAERLRRLVARSEPQRELDLMICGAFIEARSCERFALLGDAIGAPLRELFHGLHEAEARHYQVYLKLAGRAALRAALDLQRRIEEFAHLEAELITSADPVFRFHSGPPV